MNNIKVIAVCGLKRCGKDTVCNYIAEHYDYKHEKIAQPLKDICKILFNFTEDQVEANAKDVIDVNWNITPRSALQFLGTEMFQFKIQELLPEIKRNFWIERLRNSIVKNTVISDLRFVHEYKSLHDRFGKNLTIIKVMRRDVASSEDTHVSELEWLKIPEDYLIENNTTIESLHSKIKDIIIM